MFSKLSLLATICLIAAVFQIPGCHKVDNEMRPIGQHKDGTSDLVIIFKKDATRDDINNFLETVIATYIPDQGHDSLPGIRGGNTIKKDDYEGWRIMFRKNATSRQKKLIKRKVKESPVVYKVYENVDYRKIIDL